MEVVVWVFSPNVLFCSRVSWLENYTSLSEMTMQPDYSLLSGAKVVSTSDNHFQPLVGKCSGTGCQVQLLSGLVLAGYN